MIGDVCNGALGFDSRDTLPSAQPEACELYNVERGSDIKKEGWDEDEVNAEGIVDVGVEDLD